ncbi:glutamate receptor ionotropic, kainate 4 isoform X2 [Nasonia vitripennis]|uniref:Ionotropic glutamate receptor C-terminal domain-containing protein n=1 Tax=Nasonia vitripennis TaxID=7425 RepID=A0A7M7Q989_NASVI|nr:glutamate receptor ionotropic, kainate 4 isoform X2 [Nasonia vitripennis]
MLQLAMKKMKLNKFYSFLIIVCTCTIISTTAAVQNIKIGAIFHKGDEDLILAFDEALRDLDNEQNKIFNLKAVKKINIEFESFKVATVVCELLADGVAAIFGPKFAQTRDIVSSIASRFNIPHIEFSFREISENDTSANSINIYPSSKMYGKVIAKSVKHMNWHSFTFVYQTDEALSRIQETLKNQGRPNYPITIRELQPLYKINLLASEKERDNIYESLVKEIKSSQQYSLLLDVENENLSQLLDVMNKMDLMSDYFMCLITDLDTSMIDVGKFISKDSVANITQFQLIKDKSCQMQVEAALLYDSVFAFNDAISNSYKDYDSSRNIKKIIPKPLSCTGEAKYEIGLNITRNFIKKTKFGKKTGYMSFTAKGERLFELDIINIQAGRSVTVGKWEKEDLKINRDEKEINNTLTEAAKSKIFKVTTRVKADFAICDLTITSERQSAVDFTAPFMNLGISILFSKPEKEVPKLFAFMSPLSTEVWMYMATAYLIVSLMLFFQARVAPGEWTNPHPCNPKPDELENNFTLMNSMWLTMGSLMQQGSDILPRTPSIRMVAGMWWFFVLIMVSSYTANLAAFLTAVKMEDSINDVEDLAKQTKISYGALRDGSTYSFFKNSNTSLYQRIFNTMSDAKPSVFTQTNDEGVDRVIKGKRKYAFFMESTSIEYQIERHCELQMVGSLLDNKGYGIAMPPNSPYRTMISTAILHLQEKGELQQLKQKWWKEMGGGKCNEETDEPTNSNELGMSHVAGVFIVLSFGCVISILIAIIEFVWNIRKIVIEEKITFFEALIGELKFVINIRAVTKPVKINKSSSKSSYVEGHSIGKSDSIKDSIISSIQQHDYKDTISVSKLSQENNTNKMMT